MSFLVCLAIAGSIILISLFLGILVSALLEYIALVSRARSRYIEGSLTRLFGNREGVRSILAHPVLQGLVDQHGRLPSYIDPNLLAEAILGVLVADIPAPVTSENFETAIEKMSPPQMKGVLVTLLLAAQKDPRIFVNYLSHWLDRSLNTLAEPYKIRAHCMLFLLSLIVCVGLNVNFLTITDAIYSHAELREATALFGRQYGYGSMSGAIKDCGTSPDSTGVDPRCDLASAINKMTAKAIERGSAIPAGWSNRGADASYAAQIIGWTLTAILVAIGACLFFDLSKQFIGIRYGLRRPAAAPLRLTA